MKESKNVYAVVFAHRTRSNEKAVIYHAVSGSFEKALAMLREERVMMNLGQEWEVRSINMIASDVIY